MYRNIGVTKQELLKMREEGYSNSDIANTLGITYQTVLRYIGKQPEKMESLAAYEKPKKVIEIIPSKPSEAETALQKLDVLLAKEVYRSKENTAEIAYEDKKVLINDQIYFSFEEFADFATFILSLATKLHGRQMQ